MRKLTVFALASGIVVAGAGFMAFSANADNKGRGEGHWGMHHGESEGGWGRGSGFGGWFGRPHGGPYGGFGGKGGGFSMKMFDRLDENDDGSITMKEASKMAKKGMRRLARFDTNKDGAITSNEIDAWQADMRKKMLERLDADKDGKIDEADNALRVKHRFERFDADKDGKVTREEVAELMGDWRQHRREGFGKMLRDFWGGGGN